MASNNAFELTRSALARARAASPRPSQLNAVLGVPRSSFGGVVKTLLTVVALVLNGSVPAETPAPDFVMQVLEPTGGTILRPKDWFYVENHRGPVYSWTLSREDISKTGGYTTGVRIQVFIGVKKGTGKTAHRFILDFLADKQTTRVDIVRSCGETDQGLFSRTCLETLEGPHHILYSLFWGTRDNLDIAVVSIAGTKRELWSTYASTFDKMSAFELIDMKRFEPGRPTTR